MRSAYPGVERSQKVSRYKRVIKCISVRSAFVELSRSVSAQEAPIMSSCFHHALDRLKLMEPFWKVFKHPLSSSVVKYPRNSRVSG